MQLYKYIGYGQKIESDSCFDQFVLADFEGEPDIVIHHYVEDSIKDILKNECQVSKRGHDIFYRNQVGYFEARNGNEIFFEEYPDQDEAEAREFVMGNTMALLFYERDMNVIHGSAVRYKEKTIIISGDSGAGKSTTASMLIRNGAKLISDDQSIVYLDDGKVMLLPGYPSQKLCTDAAERNDYQVDKLKKIDYQNNKYAIPRMEQFFGEKSSVDLFIFLSLHEEGDELSCYSVKGADKVEALTQNLFLRPFFESHGLPPNSMMNCIQIASVVDMAKISRKIGANTETELLNYISSLI